MTSRYWVMILFSVLLLLAACTDIERLEDVLKQDIEIQEYFSDNPDAKMSIDINPPEDHPGTRVARIQQECGAVFDPNGYSYVVVDSATADFKIVVFMDTNDIVCLIEVAKRQQRAPVSCTDPDICNTRSLGTVDYAYAQGGQTKTGTFTDVCLNESFISEGRCDGNRFQESIQLCYQGCENGACNAAAKPITVPPASPIMSAINISYGSDDRHKYDIFYREEFVDAPVVFFAHGGGWIEGDKERITRFAKYFTSRGFILVSTNYRRTTLDGQDQFPIPINDIACGLATVKKQITQYGGDPTKVFISGGSAGAHMTSLIAYYSEYGWLDGCAVQDSDIDVIGFIGFVGAYDWAAVPTERWQVGCFIKDQIGISSCGSCPDTMSTWSQVDPALWTDSNPVDNINTGDPPAILVHGLEDCFSSKPDPTTGECTMNGDRMSQALQDNGVYVDLLVVPGYTHDVLFAGLYQEPVMKDRIEAFMNGVLNDTLP